jgi:hypothetical protein
VPAIPTIHRILVRHGRVRRRRRSRVRAHPGRPQTPITGPNVVVWSVEQNGRHERMHRDLKAETTRPAAACSLSAQQRRFNAFRHTFNERRPHEALHQRRPAALYAPSDRLHVPRLRPITYPEHFEIRRVSTNGGIRWHQRWVNALHILATLPVGLEPLAGGTWNVFFGPIHLGWLDERDYRIHDRRGRTQREHHLSPTR